MQATADTKVYNALVNQGTFGCGEESQSPLLGACRFVSQRGQIARIQLTKTVVEQRRQSLSDIHNFVEESMKKTFSIVAALLMVACLLAFAACGNKTDDGTFDTSKRITVITRADGSGTKSAFMEIIGLKNKPDVSGVIKAADTAAVLSGVQSNKYAIAFDSLGYVLGEKGITVLTVDGVAPTAATIKDGSYPISRPLSVVYKPGTLDNKLYKAYYDFLFSSDGQAIVAAEGYTASVDNATAYVADETLEGEIALTGSTSCQPVMTKLAKKFESLQSKVKVTVGGTGSSQGYNDAKNDVSPFGMISEVFVQSKAEGCTSTAFAMDGIALIVNAQNTLKNITKDQLKHIYGNVEGETQLTVWSQIITE